MRNRLITRLAAALVALAAATAPALAEDLSAASALPAEPIGLSDHDREAALEAGAARAANELPINGLDRRVHGEIGMEIGSRGSRALYGSAIVPLGESGSAEMSFMTGQTARWRPR